MHTLLKSHVFRAAIVVIVLAIIYIVISLPQINVRQQSVQTTPSATVDQDTLPSSWELSTEADPQVLSVLSRIQRISPSSTISTTNPSADVGWVTQSNELIPLLGRFINFQPGSSELTQSIKDVLTDSGFLADSRNDADNRTKDVIYPYQKFGFIHDDVRCLIYQRVDSSLGVDVACGVEDKVRYIFSQILRREMYPTGMHLGETVLLYPEKIRGDFAFGSMVHADEHSMFWIGKRINGVWQAIVPDIHEAVACALVDQYQIPSDMAPNCVEADGYTQRQN